MEVIVALVCLNMDVLDILTVGSMHRYRRVSNEVSISVLRLM